MRVLGVGRLAVDMPWKIRLRDAANVAVSGSLPSHAEMNDSPPVQPGDFEALLELLDEQTMREVVALFVASAPARLDSARDGLASGDTARASTAFHTLRSGCGQLGARRLEELCASGEQLAKRGDVAAATARLSDVLAEYDRCLEWFRTHGWLGA
jgi:HPt (histidine-containing phosphotransfer) domain-containing protein